MNADAIKGESAEERIVQQIIAKSLNALTAMEKGERFSEASIATVLRIAFETRNARRPEMKEEANPRRRTGLVGEAAGALRPRGEGGAPRKVQSPTHHSGF